MGKADYTVGGTLRLYTSQTQAVIDVIEAQGFCTSKAAYVQSKYQESAASFLAVYQWFAKRAATLVPVPEEGELPYWAFADLHSLESSGADHHVLELAVPADQAVLFDMYDWVKVLRFEYLGNDEADEKAVKNELRQCGLTEYTVMMSQFYPEWREKISSSWNRLFRHHQALLQGDCSGVGSVQAALWRIEKSWIVRKS